MCGGGEEVCLFLYRIGTDTLKANNIIPFGVTAEYAFASTFKLWRFGLNMHIKAL